jgi:hypothetical protein
MLRVNGEYILGIPFIRFLPLNPDLHDPCKIAGETEIRIVGGIGPFDFSDEADRAAIPLTIKFDNNDAETVLVDLTAVADIAAVTVAELVLAITTAGPTDIDVSIEAVTGRILFQYNGTETEPNYIQIYGACAEIAKLGQGLGVRFLHCDTMESFNDVPVIKDSERIAVVDARGKETVMITDSYRQGATIEQIDTAYDLNLRQLLEGGHINPDNGAYEVPTSEDQKIYFLIEAFVPFYNEGENLEANIAGWYKKTYRKCVAEFKGINHQRDWGKPPYTINVTPYRNISGVLYGDTQELPLTIEEYEAYDVYNV